MLIGISSAEQAILRYSRMSLIQWVSSTWLESYCVSESYPDDAAEDANKVSEQIGVLHHAYFLVKEPCARAKL